MEDKLTPEYVDICEDLQRNVQVSAYEMVSKLSELYKDADSIDEPIPVAVVRELGNSVGCVIGNFVAEFAKVDSKNQAFAELMQILIEHVGMAAQYIDDKNTNKKVH